MHAALNSIVDGPITIHAALNSIIFDGPITKLLSILCILIEILPCAHAKGKKSVMISNLALLLVVLRVTARQAWQ